MKTKIFKHKLLAAGTIAVLGLGVSTAAQAIPEGYAVSILKVSDFSTTVEVGNPANIILLDGLQSSESDCSSSETVPDGDSPIGGYPAPPPFPIGLNAEVANCNTPAGATRAEDDYNERGKVANQDYGNGDAAVLLTDIITNGAASSIAEAYLQTVPAPGDDINYKGGGNNNVTTNFELVENTQFTYAFNLEYRNFAELNEADLPSAATAQSSFELSITNSAGEEVFGFSPLNNSQSNAAASPDNPVDGDGVVQMGAFSSTTDILPPGLYQLKISMKNDANVRIAVEIPVGKDHFLCYKSFGHFLRDQVDLVDQFNEIDPDTGEPLPIGYDVLKPKMFCNPAIKPIRDPEHVMENPDAHLLSYKINEAHRQPRHERQTLIMRDQFFTALPIQTVRPDRLMVPSGKSLDGTVPAQVVGINHFKCYRVRSLDGFQSISVNVADQFTDPDLDLTDPLVEPLGKDLVLVRPTRMCTPVQKTRENGEVTPIVPDPNADPADPRDHLMCYRVKADRGVRLNRRTEVTSSNQFRDEDLVLKRELEFCAPASKTVTIGG